MSESKEKSGFFDELKNKLASGCLNTEVHNPPSGLLGPVAMRGLRQDTSSGEGVRWGWSLG